MNSEIGNKSSVEHKDDKAMSVGRKHAFKIALVLIITSVVVFKIVDRLLANADTAVAMRMEHMELYHASAELWPVYAAATEALRTAAAAQPEDGAPINPRVVELIDQQKSVLEKYSTKAEAEFDHWEKFDVRHFEGVGLNKRRALNSYHVRLIRDAVENARKSAQLAFADIPTGPNSAVLVKAAAQDFSKISSYQVEARASRERTFAPWGL